MHSPYFNFFIFIVLPADADPPHSSRLIDETLSGYQGRVDVYNGTTSEWGTVCDDFITNAAGSVVCRELGYAGPVKAIG